MPEAPATIGARLLVDVIVDGAQEVLRQARLRGNASPFLHADASPGFNGIDVGHLPKSGFVSVWMCQGPLSVSASIPTRTPALVVA